MFSKLFDKIIFGWSYPVISPRCMVYIYPQHSINLRVNKLIKVISFFVNSVKYKPKNMYNMFGFQIGGKCSLLYSSVLWLYNIEWHSTLKTGVTPFWKN